MGAAQVDGYPHIGSVYEFVYRNSSNQSPSQNDTLAWIQQYGLFNNTLMPGVSSDTAILNAFSQRECTYIIETGCMTVQWRSCTGTNGQPPYSAEQGLDALATALGG